MVYGELVYCMHCDGPEESNSIQEHEEYEKDLGLFHPRVDSIASSPTLDHWPNAIGVALGGPAAATTTSKCERSRIRRPFKFLEFFKPLTLIELKGPPNATPSQTWWPPALAPDRPQAPEILQIFKLFYIFQKEIRKYGVISV